MHNSLIRFANFLALDGTGQPGKLAASAIWCWAVLFLYSALFHIFCQQETLASWPDWTLEATGLALVYGIAARGPLTGTTLGYLAFPYLLFFPAWLKPGVAWPMLLLLLAALALAIRDASSREIANPARCLSSLSVFMVIIAWTVVSGAGSYGYQSTDYRMHNGRLQDLMTFPWPVRYGENVNLVYYVGYYLPSAVLGKLSSATVAFRSMLPWTVMGITLAIRWLALLSGRQLTLGLLLLFAAFGPQDLPAQLISYLWDPLDKPHPSVFSAAFWNDNMEFWFSMNWPFFVGSPLSNTFQLYWAPHQILAGWLVGAMLFQAFLQKNNRLLPFAASLLCLWSPIIMVALSPMLLLVFCLNLPHDRRASFSLPNLYGALLLAPLFLVFYTSGSALYNPHRFTLDGLDAGNMRLFLLFQICTWGLYIAVCWPAWRQQDTRSKWFFTGLAANLCLLTLLVYGLWSDLTCRGSAPLMFCLLVVALRSWRHFRERASHIGILLLSLCLLAGTGSFLQQTYVALKNYGQIQEAVRGDKYLLALQFMGPDESLFGRLFRRQISP